MQIIVRNIAKVPNKYVKLLKWKMYNLAEKFKDLIYIEAFINSEGNKPIEYQLKLRLGIPGHDIIITKKSDDVEKCIPLLYSLGMIAVAGILYCLQLSVESFSLQVKLGFLSKILLVVGIISLWLFGISDSTKKEKSTM